MEELLADITTALDEMGVPYMITGNIALNFYTLPRSTRDIDLVIEALPEKAEDFIQQFNGPFYLEPNTVRQEWVGKGVGMFNLIDQQTFYKIDFIVRKPTRYETVKFNRRQKMDLGDRSVWVISPEDLILSKLQWVQQLQSERQLSDITQLLKSPDLDLAYLQHWIRQLNLETFGAL